MKLHLPLRSRRGTSLMELLAIVTVTSLLMMLATVTLIFMMRLGHESGERIAWQTTWHRLSLDFLGDVHPAREAVLLEEASGVLRLTLSPEELIDYRVVAGGIERLRYEGEALAATESYRLPEAYAATLSLGDGPGGLLAAIALSRAVETGGAPIAVATQPLRIEAYVGLDRRIAAIAQEDSP